MEIFTRQEVQLLYAFASSYLQSSTKTLTKYENDPKLCISPDHASLELCVRMFTSICEKLYFEGLTDTEISCDIND